MQELRHLLVQEQKRLETIINKARSGLESAPEGRLRISCDKNKPRYYQYMSADNETYIPKAEMELARLLAQKNYNESVVKKAEARLKQITWDQLLKMWYEEEYQGKEFKEGTPLILTEKGERVRSKSEKILADYFYRNNIPYKYEKPLYLKGYGIVYPDFTLLSKKTYQEIYWEHEGMMDKQDYARAAVRKIELYQLNNIYPGEQLIMTFETEQSLLNSRLMEKLTEKYLC